jgi:starvation-inducible DNA-binding protein
MFPTKNSIPLEQRVQLIELLNIRLAEATDLYSHAKNAHWNIKGANFVGLHQLFDDIAKSVSKHADTLAERAVQLGGTALGTIHSAVQSSRLPLYPVTISNERDHLNALIESVSIFAKNVRVAQGWCTILQDQDTMDIFVEISRDMDRYLWMLEAHLE